MPERDLGRPITVINRFDVKGDTAKFEQEFREHSQFLRRREDFDFLVTVKLADRPHVYVHLVHWRTHQGFLDTVHDQTFLAHVQRLGPMVETEADQAVSVGRLLLENASVGAENIVLVQARVNGEWRAFEKLFDELNEHCRTLDGFGGSDLLRSTVSPLQYTGIQWWRDKRSCDHALSSDGYRTRQEGLAGLAQLTVERSRHVAYERVLG